MGFKTLIFGKNSNGDDRPLKVDNSSDAIQTISYPHHEIHAGTTFKVCTTTTSLADNGVQEFVITVGTKQAHAIYEGNCGGNALIGLFESPTGVAGTNSITPINLNRDSDKTAQSTVIQQPDSIAADGTSLNGKLIPGGTGGNATGNSISNREEFILKPLTTYLLRLTNIAGAAKAASTCLEWYEHTPKN